MEISIVKFFQQLANDFLDGFFWFVTKMGEETFFLIGLLVIYIAYDKKFAIKYIYFYMISVAINNLLKLIFKRPRPYSVSDKILDRLHADGYSFPSGHTQGYFVQFSTGMQEINKNNVKKTIKLSFLVLFLLLGIGVMLSRMYWGQHYLSDVVVGMMFGIAIPFVLDWIMFILPIKFKNFFTIDKLYLFLGIISIIIFIVTLIMDLIFGIIIAESYIFTGVFVAMSMGYIVDKKLIKYDSQQGFIWGFLKSIVSIMIVIGLYFLIKLCVPLNSYIYFIVYLFLGLVCTIILPLLFKCIFKKRD